MTIKNIRKLINEEITRVLLQEQDGSEDPKVEFPDWLQKKIEDVHGNPGQGSIFTNPSAVKEEVMKLISSKKDQIKNIASTTGTLKSEVSGIGYDLVMPKEEALSLPDAKEETVEKVEGPNKLTVPAVKTSEPLKSKKFVTNQLTVIVRPKKDATGNLIPNEYIILSAFPGKDLPRASEWNGKYAVIIPDQVSGKKTESFTGKRLLERWQKIAGI